MALQAFGLACDVSRTPTRVSGYEPALFDLGSGKQLFGGLRIAGWRDMLLLNPGMHLTIVGGDEGRYKGETPVINRAEVLCKILAQDYGVDPTRLSWFASKSNTLGNIGIIKERSTSKSDIVVTNLYHAVRAQMDLRANGLGMQVIPAKAFILLANPDADARAVIKERMIKDFGGGPLAERVVEEIQGVADKIAGTYKSLTDAAPITFGARAKV